jgi:osmotically-inducible protein OsmY
MTLTARALGMAAIFIAGMAGMALSAASDDLRLADRVQQRLLSDGHVRTDRILVEATDGHVVLRGAVDSPSMKQAATSAAISVPGVHSIDNALTVAGEAPSDVQLETAVMDVMSRSALTATGTIVAHVTKGEVTLEGVVPSDLAKREASRLAQTVLGVAGIRNRLSVTHAQTAGVPAETAPSPLPLP